MKTLWRNVLSHQHAMIRCALIWICGLLLILAAVKCNAQEPVPTQGLQFEYAAVEVTNGFFTIHDGTTNICYIAPIPSDPRKILCTYRIGVDWNTNFPVWITVTNTVYIYHTNYLAQIPQRVTNYVTVQRYALARTPLTKRGALATPLKNVQPLPVPPKP